ncbi:hypothetical protein HHI36_002922 [Cryptolaemus montrouzieri]|uniref:Uncharacterized protein n=1 Tax=Cryptolaemus montrouzieri TaxID=559131 RepID=A0ABD2PC38_9CUCU
MCYDGEVLKSGCRASASVLLSDADVELIVAELSKVFQLQFDKFENKMRTECFAAITALTNKFAELSSQHGKHVGFKVGNKPRPIKIITSCPEVGADVLRECKKPDNTNYLLYREREYMARLEQELAGRTEQGESVVIRHVNGQTRIVSRKH